MRKDIFEEQLRKATVTTIEFAKTLCWNTFSENCVYIILPSGRDYSNHLDSKEHEVLRSWNKNKNNELSFGEAINLLCHYNRVPLWINIAVYRSLPNKTVIELLCSRRLRESQELLHQREIPPFHISIALPIGYSRETEPPKFDVNWRYNTQKPSRKIIKLFNKAMQYLKTL